MISLWMKNIRKPKLILWILLPISFFTLLSLIFILPMYKEAELLQAQINLEAKKVKEINDFLNQYPNLAEAEKELNEKFIYVEKKLPDDARIGEFIKAVEEQAIRYKINLVGIKQQEPIAHKAYCEIPFKMEIVGDYFQIVAFLHNIEQFERFISVKKMVLKAEENVLHGELFISIYGYETLKIIKKQENDHVVSNST